MIWPTLIVDNFLNEPLQMKEFANKQTFTPSPEGKWPGTRSDYLHNLSPQLFNQVTKKILTLLYPYEVFEGNMDWSASVCFQKIAPQVSNEGWIHTDEEEFTAMIYLSSHTECGTSLHDLNPFTTKKFVSHFDKKHKMILKQDKHMKKFQEETNNQFKETVKIKSKFNRLILFDSACWHKADQYKEDHIKEDRLTLICFFKNIKNNKTVFRSTLPSAGRIPV